MSIFMIIISTISRVKNITLRAVLTLTGHTCTVTHKYAKMPTKFCTIPTNCGELAIRSVWEGEMRLKGGEVDWKQRRDDQKQRPDRKRYETDKVMMQTFGNS